MIEPMDPMQHAVHAGDHAASRRLAASGGELAFAKGHGTGNDFVILPDPDGVLEGAGITKRVRWLTFVPGDRLDRRSLTRLVHAAAVVARMGRGELVSDDLVCTMVYDRLKQTDCRRGYVLDGFPRTAAQAGWLDALLETEFFDKSRPTRAWPIVVRLDVDYNKLLLRITGRRSCPTCGRIYNVYFQPPRVDELCDETHATKLVTRNDDRLEVIQPRLTAYQEQTRPVADYYQRTGRLIRPSSTYIGARPASHG